MARNLFAFSSHNQILDLYYKVTILMTLSSQKLYNFLIFLKPFGKSTGANGVFRKFTVVIAPVPRTLTVPLLLYYAKLQLQVHVSQHFSTKDYNTKTITIIIIGHDLEQNSICVVKKQNLYLDSTYLMHFKFFVLSFLTVFTTLTVEKTYKYFHETKFHNVLGKNQKKCLDISNQ